MKDSTTRAINKIMMPMRIKTTLSITCMKTNNKYFDFLIPTIYFIILLLILGFLLDI